MNETVRAYVAARSAERHHLVVYLSGAHAYGFPSPDSDFDLKCVHVAPTGDLVGMVPREGGVDAIETIDGVEIDYGSNEIGGVLRGVLRGNGIYLERLLGTCIVEEDAPRMAALRPLARAALCRRVHHHYAGFARSQLHAAVEKPLAKKVLYVLRTTLTGTHLLATGEVVTDLSALADPYQFSRAHELIAIKRAGERVPLDDSTWTHWRAELDRAFATLDAALQRSALPPEPPAAATAALDAWLIDLRRAMF